MKIKQLFTEHFKFVVIGLVILFSLIDLMVFAIVKHQRAVVWQQTPNVSQLSKASTMKSGKYVVLFYQRGCVYCQKAMPTIQKEKKLAAKHHVKYLQVNTRSKLGRELTGDYTIESTPTFLLINKEKGKKVQIAPVSITYDKKKQNKKINPKNIGVKTKTIKSAMKGDWSWMNNY
ncbi:thioredoxin family protein [Pediococcus inopinatus]|uniref:Thioredoxin family protein n=1 Tax=Pediococcus inopinatus TaxID=114090 RepID=A0ABZ0Q3L0_9LACO|nr:MULTISPECIES: thioredoxin domain-containing protein [Pediococcus]AVL00195.1 thioredoxin [Pediococcus inopinatus]KRN61792.1 hypothetical protein IV83_GL000497 [Pediococcus inopinatus]PIO80371.1 thioredoxin [Pediococcus damnosus]WPC19311.1 thioredoxin family protein [Pediococcus inopinatus]WPC21102.1 thioredoxin family protein [Pediococcus inopinatus]